MTASANDLFIKVGEGTATTLAAPGYTIGATSVTVVSTTNWPTDTGVVFAIDVAEIVDGEQVQVAGTYCEFEGVVSDATTVASLDLVSGTPQNYAAGALTRVYIPVSSETNNRMVDGILEEHDQTGAHTDVTADSLAVAGDIAVADGNSIVDGNANELLTFEQTASAVNDLSVTNAATGNAPSLSATGGDTNINLELTPKGTGKVTKAGLPIDWWEELGRTTLGIAGDSISVTGIPARKYLRIVYSVIPSGQVDVIFNFNNDTGANYATRVSTDGGADATGTSAGGLTAYSNVTTNTFGVFDVVNISAQEKLLSGMQIAQTTAGAGTAPSRRDLVAKWANTSAQITRVDLTNADSGDYGIGSEIVVLGHD
jgi:hypothetical protein